MFHGRFQYRWVRRAAEPYRTFTAFAESDAWRNRYPLSIEQFKRERKRITDALDAGKEIEGAVGRTNRHAVCRIQGIVTEGNPLVIGIDHIVNIRFTVAKRNFARPLNHRGGV